MRRVKSGAKRATKGAKDFRDKLRHHFDEVIKTKTTPESIALGFSLGTFLAIFPTPGFSILLGFILILIFEKISKLAMMGAFAIWNPVTLVPIYILSYNIGRVIGASLPPLAIRIDFINHAYNMSRSIIVGNIVLAVVLGIISYFIVKKIATRYQESISS